MADLFEESIKQYPFLASTKFVPVLSLGKETNNYLESWVPGEMGTPDRPRPVNVPKDVLGVEVFRPDTSPRDIAADVVSHHLINVDPEIKKHYATFTKELTPQQKQFLMGDYNPQDEKDPEKWMQRIGLPSALRGMAFGQFTPEDQKKFGLTDKQKSAIEAIQQRLSKPMGAKDAIKKTLKED